MKEVKTTLCILKQDKEILLALKKRGFGAGKYNGVGGKIEENETPEEAMIRETKEEINVTPIEYEKYGEISFIEYNKGEKEHLIFYLYICSKWQGNIEETEEMKPNWFDINSIPYDEMFSDDRYWLPLVLDGKKVKCFFEFDENFKILKKEIHEVNGDIYE